jgi:aryl-phospho-beta-D-glucosidase BglC (GH1 family)
MSDIINAPGIEPIRMALSPAALSYALGELVGATGHAPIQDYVLITSADTYGQAIRWGRQLGLRVVLDAHASVGHWGLTLSLPALEDAQRGDDSCWGYTP